MAHANLRAGSARDNTAPTPFEINGCTPFSDEAPERYVEAAHAVAILAAASFDDQDRALSTNAILMASFEAIALLLACAERCRENAGGVRP